MPADLVVTDTDVITMADAPGEASGFAVTGDRFVAVDGDLDRYVGADTVVKSFPDATVVPGFYDAHCHLTSRAQQLLRVDIGPDAVGSIDDMVDVLADEAAATPTGEWIEGGRYDETKLAEGRHPTRWDLDAASTEHPIFVMHCGAHGAVVNTRGLELAGWADGPPAEYDEFVEYTDDGEFTGLVREDAKDVFTGNRGSEGLIPALTREERLEGIRAASEVYAGAGITSVADMSGTPDSIRMLVDGHEAGALSVRVTTVVRPPFWEGLADIHLRSGFGDDRLQLGQVKETADGAIAARTAYLSAPYEGRPDYRGDLRTTQDELDDLVGRAHEAGFQVGIHANGDATIRMVVDAFRKALEASPREDHRHRIEHCTVVTEALLDEIAELGLVVNPFSTYLYQHGEKMADYGDRVERMFAHGSFLERGIPTSGTSDNPAGLLDPLLGIQTMVTRRTRDGEVLGPEQRISVAAALHTYTMGSAYSTFDEADRGSIEPGKLADFVVLSDDPRAVPPDDIAGIDVRRTFVGGEAVYRDDAAA